MPLKKTRPQEIEFEALLKQVEKPSRYLGTEVNHIRKKGPGFLRVGLAFPDLYEIGASHFGLQILYEVLNRDKSIAAERIYLPAPDMGRLLRENKLELMTLETRTPLSELSILGFSLLYELNYSNVLEILNLADLPFYSKDRDESHPLIIAGGPSVANPEPMAPFFDLMLLGDGEEVFLQICKKVQIWENEGRKDKNKLLKELSKLDGVYIPSFYTAVFDENGVQSLIAGEGAKEKIKKALIASLESAPLPLKPVLPFTNPVHDRLRLEIARGCSRGCRFCQAGMLYRPVRERSLERLLEIAEISLKNTGYSEMSLLSLSTGDYSCLPELLEELMQRYAEEHKAVSLPSIRADRLKGRLIEEIQKVRKTGFTIAPEAGSQRLRDVINKDISEEEIYDSVKEAISSGWRQIKLYFMIGLPTETMEDIEAIVKLADKLRHFRTPENKWGQIVISVGAFIPKAHSPFQWAAMIRSEEAIKKLSFLKTKLRMPGVQLKWHRIETSILEALFARGDRSLAPLLVRAWEKGCILDGWSDHFREDLWKEAIKEEGIDIDFYVHRNLSLDEKLNWDHMDIRVSKEFLREEWEKAFKEEISKDCREAACLNCGICDFKEISPELFQETPDKKEEKQQNLKEEREYRDLILNFEKTGPARFFGHLEMVEIFLKALNMAGLKLNYSLGFNPKAEISFQDTLPLGMASLAECFLIKAEVKKDLKELKNSINKFLPSGLKITGCLEERKIPKADIVYYNIKSRHAFDYKKIQDFNEKKEYLIEKKNKKGKITSLDLKKFIHEIKIENQTSFNLALKSFENRSIRPAVILSALEEQSTDIEIIKTGIA